MGWHFFPQIPSNLDSDTVSNGCVCTSGAAKDEMKGNLNIFSFLSPTSIQFLLSIHSVSVCEICICSIAAKLFLNAEHCQKKFLFSLIESLFESFDELTV